MKFGKDYIGVFVSAVCHNGHGQFLLSKRSEKARDLQGHWEFGGGTVELGESLEQALRREYKEEYQAELSDLKQIDIRDFIDEDGHRLGVFYTAKIDNPDDLKSEDEAVEEFGWYTLDTIPGPLMTGDDDRIAEYVNKI